MKKPFVLLLFLCLLLSLPAALADTLTLPDPGVYSGGALSFNQSADSEYALYRVYTVEGDNAEQYAQAYIEMLKKEPTLKYAGSSVQDHGSYFGTHYYFVPNGADYGCFTMADTEGNICADVFYDYGGSYTTHNVILICSTDFTLSSAPLLPVGAAAAQPAAAPTAASKSASAHDLQDPMSFFGDLLSDHDESNLVKIVDRQGVKIAAVHSFSFFAEEDSDALARIAAAYDDYLSQHTMLQYSGSDTNKGGWIYRWYTLENAADSDLFNYSNTNEAGEWNRFTPSVVIMYSSEYSEIQFLYALSFTLADLNYRLDETEHDALSEIAAAYALKRAEEEAARKAEEEKAAAAQSQSSSGGSSSFSWSSSSSSSANRTTRCHSCGGDGDVSCSNCSGRGYKEKRVSTPNYSGSGAKYETVKETCYRCHGSGTVDCSTCGGDGKVEY